MRRALGLAVALWLAGAAPAPAQQAGTPVVGGGSFNTAPLIESGTYRDTLLPGERLLYAIQLEAGQRLRLAAELDVEEDQLDAEGASGFSIGTQTPLREVEVLDLVDEDITGNSSVTTNLTDRLEFISPPVLAASGARESSGNYRGPGTWYVSLYLSSTENEPPRIEVPVEMELEVMGEPQPDAAPEPTPAEATPALEPQEQESGGGGASTLAVAGIGLAGLVVGLVGGAAAGRRRSS